MEAAPLVEDDDSDFKPDKKESRKSKDRKPESIGLVAIEPTPESPRKSLFSLEKPEPVKIKPETPSLEMVETSPVSETAAPLEQIGEAEKPIIERQLTIVAQQASVEQSSEQATDPEQIAGDEAVEHFRDLIVEGEDSDTALKNTLAKLGAEAYEIDGQTEVEESDSDELTEEVSIDHQDEAGSIEAASSEAAVEENDETDATSTATNGGSGQPPIPPAGTVPPPGFGSGWGGGPGGFGVGGFNPNTAAPTPAPPTEAEPQVESVYRGNPADSALIGGIIGYLIGRRRGRIKTEKKLLPIQKRLEKQVYNLEWELKKKESTIRRVAAEKVRTTGPVIIERLNAAHSESSKQPEHLGHMMISASESSKDRRTEKRPESKLNIEEAHIKLQAKSAETRLPDKSVETLSRAELLSLSEKIIIEGSSLRQIYETHLVGERGLRRLVAEHLRGGDLNKALRREIVEREIDFERDPALRDIVPTAPAAGASGGGSAAALDQLLKAANVDVGDSGEEVAFFRARAKYEASHLHQLKKQRQIINLSFVAITGILVLVILVLYMTRA